MAGIEGMDPAFAAALQRLMAATGGQVTINSGYRSPERQAQLFAAAVKKYGSEDAARHYVAPPGKSNHNKGVAADLHFANDRARQMAHQLAPQFGLIFPMSWENWHIEPVGARDGAAPQAYTTPTGGGVHPQDPMYTTVNPDVNAAQLAYALGAYDPKMTELLEGGYPTETGGPPEQGESGEPLQAMASVGGGGSGAATNMGGDADSWIRQAMAVTGVGADWYPGLKARMMQESGGRNIPQGIVDINTKKGTPAFGPMQVIQPTFNAYAAEGHTDWHNPLDNTIAAINYIKSRYGHPSNLPKGGY